MNNFKTANLTNLAAATHNTDAATIIAAATAAGCTVTDVDSRFAGLTMIKLTIGGNRMMVSIGDKDSSLATTGDAATRDEVANKFFAMFF